MISGYTLRFRPRVRRIRNRFTSEQRRSIGVLGLLLGCRLDQMLPRPLDRLRRQRVRACRGGLSDCRHRPADDVRHWLGGGWKGAAARARAHKRR